MTKKIFASLLVIFIMNFIYLPVLAKDNDYKKNNIIDAQY